MKRRNRYSNIGGTGVNLSTGSGYNFGSFDDLGGTSGLMGGASSSSSGSTWTSQDTVSVVNTGANLIQTVLTSIFGRNNVQQAQYTNQLYQQEQRTNTILWVVLGLVLALGVVLVIRKTK